MRAPAFGRTLGAALISAALWVASPATTRADDVIHYYGDWRITTGVLSSGETTFTLIGVGQKRGDAEDLLAHYFWLKCYERDPGLSLDIPHVRSPADGTLAVDGTVWSDQDPPRQFRMYVYRPDNPEFTHLAYLMNIGYDGGGGDSIETFVETLLRADARFAYEFGSASVHFDMTDFPAAWATFGRYCGLR